MPHPVAPVFGMSRKKNGFPRLPAALAIGAIVIAISASIGVWVDKPVPPGPSAKTKDKRKERSASSCFPRAVALSNGQVEIIKLSETTRRKDAFPKPPIASSTTPNATTYIDKENTCEPYASWSKDVFPTCNSVHDMSLERSIVDISSTRLLGSGRSSLAWLVYTTSTTAAENTTIDSDGEEAIVLRIQRYDRDIKTPAFQSQRTDAIILERISSSPYVMDIYGHCGLSTFNECATGGDLRAYLNNQGSGLSPEQKFSMAKDAALGLADLHSIDGINTVTVMHRDVSLNNFAVVSTKAGPRLKLHDFNTARFKTTCGFGHSGVGFSTKCDGKWKRSPEDCIGNKTLSPDKTTHITSANYPREKEDIYILGAILFYMLCGEHPYSFEADRKLPDQEYLITHLASKDFPTNAEARQIVQWLRDGRVPSFPSDVDKSTDIATMALKKAIRQAMHPDVYKRPNMTLIANGLLKTAKKLSSRKNNKNARVTWTRTENKNGASR